ncbi:MAG: hypothetical protein ACW99U_12880 [Candidatus Thorarchaeota archaeon]|jgi:hypothetical protein
METGAETVKELLEIATSNAEAAKKTVCGVYSDPDFHLTLNEEDNDFEVQFPRHFAMLDDMYTAIKYLDKLLDSEDYLTQSEVAHIKDVIAKARRVFVKRGFPFVPDKIRKTHENIGRQITPKLQLKKQWERNFGEAKAIGTITEFDKDTENFTVEIIPVTPTLALPQKVVCRTIREFEFELVPSNKEQVLGV